MGNSDLPGGTLSRDQEETGELKGIFVSIVRNTKARSKSLKP